MEIAQQMPVCLDIKDLFANAGNVLIPRKIYLYSFPDNKSMREAFEDEDFIVQELHLEEKHGALDLSFLWKKYVNRINPENYSYKYYVGGGGESYLVQIEAIARRRKFPDGSLPIACKLLGYNCYADVFSNSTLPNCFD